ncbi:MAG: HEAT repeat domain-containing protein [Planctomycetota bacterium]|nr:HEAT repeat domain-containing protein [Planctomycetota bacterium]
MLNPLTALAPVLLALGLAAPQPAPAFEWSYDLSIAMETAKAENRVVFAALDHAGEGRCEHFLKKLIKDKAVAALSAASLNVVGSTETHAKGRKCGRFDGMACSDHVRTEANLREVFLKANDEGTVAVPQYLWLNGAGEVLLSVPYELNREGLLWCMATAQALVDPEGAPAMPEDARPPRRLLMGRAHQLFDGDDRGRGLTPDELETILEGTKSNILGMVDVASILRVMATDEAEAVDFVRKQLVFTLSNFARGRTPQTVHTLGVLGTDRYWEALEEFAEIEDDEARHEVAVALEQLGSPDALKLAKAGLKREKEPALERAWLRALAASGPADKGVRKTVIKMLDEKQLPAMQASAAFALGYLQRSEDVQEVWAGLLAGDAGDLRLAAACGAALARDKTMIGAIEKARDAAEAADREVLERCLAVLAGGDLYPLEGDVAGLTGDDITRERVFFGNPEAEAPAADTGGRGGR